jgi:hypothetical protein
VYRRTIRFNKIRNEKEAHVLCRILDLLVTERRRRAVAEAMEVLIRRLIGLRAADESDDWAFADALQQADSKQLFISEKNFDRMTKEVKRIHALKGIADGHGQPSTSKSTGSGSSGTGAAAGGQKHSQQHGKKKKGNNSHHSRGPSGKDTRQEA